MPAMPSPMPAPGQPAASPPPPAGPFRLLERSLWGAVMDLDDAAALGRAHHTRPVPTVAEAADLVAALTTLTDVVAHVMCQASGDVAALAVMSPGHGAGGECLAGPALEAARALDTAGRLIGVTVDTVAAALSHLATLTSPAAAGVLPEHAHRPIGAHRPVRVLTVVAS